MKPASRPPEQIALVDSPPSALRVLQPRADRDVSHQHEVAATGETGMVTCHAGHGRRKAGEITAEREWDVYFEQFALRPRHQPSIPVCGPRILRPERPRRG